MPEFESREYVSVEAIDLPHPLEFEQLGRADAVDAVKASWMRYADITTGAVFDRLASDKEVLAVYDSRKDDVGSLTVAEKQLLVGRCLKYQTECCTVEGAFTQLRLASKAVQERHGVSFYDLRQPSVNQYPKDGFRYHMLVAGTPKGEYVINDMKRIFEERRTRQ